jgi:two-component system, chemotaxis family, protein-glutamate methylesterase/glutaminase
VIRVVVAEDSLTVRELLTEILDSDQEITVVGQARNGLEAVELTESLKPDLVTMDVHMPVMDGLAATKEIMVRAPTPILIVSASALEPDVSLSLNAIRAGALMVVSTPNDPQSPAFEKRRAELLAMAKAMAQVKVVRRWGPSLIRENHASHRRATREMRQRFVAIAASTGGPAALQRVLQDLPGDFPVPILVVQHIAAGFVGGLADWLGSTCGLRVKVAESGEPLASRTVYLAPDDRHLGVRPDQRILLSDEPPISGFRPSADFLFETAARVSGGAMTAVILTGMGCDGVAGLQAVKSCGGRVIAQDEASSVVYGMPQAAAAAGLVDWKLSIRDVGPRLLELVVGGEHGNSRPRR